MERNEKTYVRTNGLGGDRKTEIEDRYRRQKIQGRRHEDKRRSSLHLRGFFNYSNLLKLGDSSDFQLLIHDIRCL